MSRGFYLRWRCTGCGQVHTRRMAPDEVGALIQVVVHPREKFTPFKAQPMIEEEGGDTVYRLVESLDLSCEAHDEEVPDERR